MHKHHFLSSLVIFVAGFVLSAIVNGKHLASLARGSLSNPSVAEVAAQTSQKPSAPQKWEYRVVSTFNRRNTEDDINVELNRLGEQGFEIGGVAQSGSELGAANLTIILRRPR